MAISRVSLPLPSTRIVEAEVATLAQLFSARVARTPHDQACRYFDAPSSSWHPVTWTQLDDRVAHFAGALAAIGFAPGARVAIHLENGVDWPAIEQAIFRVGAVSVGVYAVETAAAATQILANSGAEVLFTRDAASWAAFCAADPLGCLRRVVLMQGEAVAGDGRAISVERFLADAVPLHTALPLPPDALASLVYTSGTSGRARGAMMSHAALLANVFATGRAFNGNERDVRLSILPLSHSFERVAGWYHGVLCGSETVFSRGVELLSEDLMSIHPTGLIGVPRLFEHLYARLLRNIEDSPLHVRALFHLAVQSSASIGDGRPHQKFSARLTAGLTSAVRLSVGGRLTTVISGGAPLCPQIARTFAALGMPILQGYGLTEAGPVVSVNRPDSFDPESAGVPLDNVLTRIAPDGELLVRSPSLMQGYWQDAESSRKAIDESGWLHTGDKASRLDAQRIYLTGRLKDVLVTSTGTKAAPAEIEAALTSEPLFDQAIVVGEARPFLAALVVAEPLRLAELKKKLGLNETATDEESRNLLEAALLTRVMQRLHALPFNYQVLRVALVPAFTLGNGLLTATAKPRRAAIFKHHAASIERLYAGHCTSLKNDCSSNAESKN